MNTPTQNKWGRRRFMFAPFMLIGLFAVSAVVMLLWNWLIPGIFNIQALNFWQAMGLLVLCRILFGRFNFRGGNRHRPPFANPAFREKFMNMSAEEKQAFKDQWKQRCGK